MSLDFCVGPENSTVGCVQCSQKSVSIPWLLRFRLYDYAVCSLYVCTQRSHSLDLFCLLFLCYSYLKFVSCFCLAFICFCMEGLSKVSSLSSESFAFTMHTHIHTLHWFLSQKTAPASILILPLIFLLILVNPTVSSATNMA